MFRSGAEQKCPGLKLPCVPHIGHYNDGMDYKLARTLGAVRFMREPHGKIPSSGFDLLMRRDNVHDVEVYLALYDMQDLRDWVLTSGRMYIVNLLYHPWLFPRLAYRGEEGANVEVAVFENAGAYPVMDSPQGVGKNLRSFEQRVWVKDKVYMCMGPDAIQLRIDRHRLVCSFWSLCVPEGEERAIVTKHVLINESRTHITREVSTACADIGDASVASVLRHLQKLLTAVQGATNRLSKLMGRCEGAFEGVPYQGNDQPMPVWEEQLALLDRSVNDGSRPEEGAPLLSEMIRRRVYEDMGRRRRKGKFPADDDETIEAGQRAFMTPVGATDAERAQAIHRVIIECIHDLEQLAECNAELLSVEGVTT